MHLLLIQLLHQRLHHFIPMLTKVLIQRIGRTFGQHHNLNASVARAFADFSRPAASGPPSRSPASLYLPAFRPLPAPDEPKAPRSPERFSCCRYCFVGHRIGMPGNNNFVIERVEHWRELHQQSFKERHNLCAAAFKHIAVLVIFNQHAQSPGTISISRFASICASRAMVLILVASSPSSVADFFFSSAVFSLTSRAFSPSLPAPPRWQVLADETG